jgi:lipopolysaccharide transport system permease protein
MHARLGLLRQLINRELHDRYRGSVLGFAWAFVLPLAMVAVYTFVFGYIFRARWSGAGDDPLAFSLFLYCGLVPYLFVADALGRAPTLLLGYASLVKKVAFPLSLLAIAATAACAVHLLIGLGMAALFAALALGRVPWLALLAPLAVAPLALAVFGAVLALASAGVFFRDLAQAVGIALPVLLFLSPVFYPIDAVPAAFRAWMRANPLTDVIESVRALVIHGTVPDPAAWLLALAGSIVLAAAGWLWFRRLKPGFADLL